LSHSLEKEVSNRALRVLPGGVASTNRLISKPKYFTQAKGAELVDCDGRRFVDYNCAFGATIIGHADPEIANRVAEASAKIGLIGLGGTDLEVELAERLVEIIPCADKVAFCNSGSEATFHALRLARAATGRLKVVKFQGAYHGWHDAVAMNVASAPSALGERDPLSAGMHPAVAADTLIARFNDAEDLQRIFEANSGQIAAVIVETILHNVGCIPARKEFLQEAKRICEKNGAVLIFDEVITGFRHALGGYQAIVGVTPHLSAFGKALGNGFPIAVLAGNDELMRHLDPRPRGDVYFAGTYNGHPVMAAAALATIERLSRPGAYGGLYELGAAYRNDLARLVRKFNLSAQPAGYGSVWLLEFFMGEKSSYEELLFNDSGKDTCFREGMLAEGHATSTKPLKRWNLTLAHTHSHREETMAAAERVLSRLTEEWEKTA
jgi:glutamate-1-semialdehyde 2,1-aminomutase